MGSITVSKNGNDLNNGTNMSPILTIKKATNIAKPGDTIIVEPGIYDEIIQGSTNANSTDNITILSKISRKSIVRGIKTEADFWSFKDFEIKRGGNFARKKDAIEITSNNVSITGNHAQSFPEWGIRNGSGSNWKWANNVFIGHNFFEKCGRGIGASGKSWSIIRNEVFLARQPDSGGDNDYARFFGSDQEWIGNYFYGADPQAWIKDFGSHIDCFQTWAYQNNSAGAKNILFRHNRVFDFHQLVLFQHNQFYGGPSPSDRNVGLTWDSNFSARSYSFMLLIENGADVNVKNSIFANVITSNGNAFRKGTTATYNNNLMFDCRVGTWKDDESTWISPPSGNHYFNVARNGGLGAETKDVDPRITITGDNVKIETNAPPWVKEKYGWLETEPFGPIWRKDNSISTPNPSPTPNPTPIINPNPSPISNKTGKVWGRTGTRTDSGTIAIGNVLIETSTGKSTISDSKGFYNLLEVPIGKQTIRASIDGYQVTVDPVLVSDNTEIRINFFLELEITSTPTPVINPEITLIADKFDKVGLPNPNLWEVGGNSNSLSIFSPQKLGLRTEIGMGIMGAKESINFNSNQYCEAQVAEGYDPKLGIQVFVRKGKINGTGRYGFHFDGDLDNINGNVEWQIKYDGVKTKNTKFLATKAGSPPKAGDILRIQAITKNGFVLIKGYINNKIFLEAKDDSPERLIENNNIIPGIAVRSLKKADGSRFLLNFPAPAFSSLTVGNIIIDKKNPNPIINPTPDPVIIPDPIPTPDPVIISHTTNSGTVWGRIGSSSNVPLKEVLIKISNNKSTTSNSNGFYEILSVPVGNYIISASINGYKTETQEITIIKDQKIRINLFLNPISDPIPERSNLGKVWGIIGDQKLTPLNGVLIKTSTGKSTTNDDDGVYKMPSIPAGKQTISASKDGYITTTQEIIVISDDKIRVNMVLIPEITHTPSHNTDPIPVHKHHADLNDKPTINKILTDDRIREIVREEIRLFYNNK